MCASSNAPWRPSSDLPRLTPPESPRAPPATGGIALDTDTFTDKSVALRTQQMEALVLHELGHVVGLDHVDDPGELMADENSGRLDLGPGDREGLALLGAVPCG